MSMILKKILINCLFVALGCFLGVLVAQYLRDELRSPPFIQIIAIFFFLAIAIGIAQIVNLKIETPGVAIPTPSIHHGTTWGWLVPRNDLKSSGYPLNKERISLGRDVKCDIMLNDESISRLHVELIRVDEGYLIRDQSSRNGLFINNQRISEQLLQEGDTISIGDLDFFYRSSIVTKKESPPPEL
jgi:hypothetical protein